MVNTRAKKQASGKRRKTCFRLQNNSLILDLILPMMQYIVFYTAKIQKNVFWGISTLCIHIDDDADGLVLAVALEVVEDLLEEEFVALQFGIFVELDPDVFHVIILDA